MSRSSPGRQVTSSLPASTRWSGSTSVSYTHLDVYKRQGCEHLPAIGLIAHMDTTPDMTGKDVKPQVIHYEGGDVVLNLSLIHI